MLDLTSRKRDFGARSDFDVASAAATLDQARAEIPTFEGEQRAQLFELAVLTGRPPGRDLPGRRGLQDAADDQDAAAGRRRRGPC